MTSLTKLLSVLMVIWSLNAYAGDAFYTGESTSGMYKTCYYNYMGSSVAISISATSLCPLTIRM